MRCGIALDPPGGWSLRMGQWLAHSQGAMLRITPWVLHHDERWFDQAHAFQPQRFMDGAPPIPNGAWMPFGAGPRVCLGQHFAMVEMTVLSAMLLQRFTLELPEGAAPCEPALHVTL